MDNTGHKLACGNARGKMMWIDFRQEKRIHPLKGPAGSVRSISRHPDHHDHVCAVGLDRHLYLFDTKTNHRKQKVLTRFTHEIYFSECFFITKTLMSFEAKKFY